MSEDNMHIYFLTGASRGIGLAVLHKLTNDPNNLIITAMRSPDQFSIVSEHKNVKTVKLDSTVETDPAAVAESLKSQGITHIDTIILSAGTAESALSSISSIKPTDFHQAMQVNTLAPLLIFQSLLPFLERSKKPVFAYITSIVGSMGSQKLLEGWQGGAYGASKAAANFLILRMALEHPNVIAMTINPGLVRTEMGFDAMQRLFGMSKDAMNEKQIGASPEQAAASILDIVAKAEKDTHSGKFLNAQEEGGELPW